MITDFINDVKELKEELRGESCIKKEPFIKLGGGNAPTLNYNIPKPPVLIRMGISL